MRYTYLKKTLWVVLFLAAITVMAQEQITVRYMVPQWASSRDVRVERQIAFQSAIDSFHLRYPQYRLQEVIGPGDQVSISQALAAGEIDAVWINHAWYADWQAAGLFADLTPYLEPGTESAFFDWTIDAMRSVDGRLGGLWHNTDTPLYFYDVTAIPEAPQTWSQVREVAERVFVETGRYGISYPIRNWAQYNMGMFVALGGDIFDEEGRPALFDEDNRALLETMFEHYATLYDLGLAPASSVAANHDQQMPPIYAGDVAAFVGNSNAELRQLRPNLPPDELTNWRSAPLPHPDGTEAGRFVAGGWVIALVANSNPETEAAAAAWVEHMTDFNALRDANKAGGWIPTRPAILEEDPYYAEDPVMVTTLEALNAGGFVVPFNPLYPVIVTALNQAVAEVLSGQQSISQALEAAQAEVMREYEAAE
jgi:ABC-type glycerol-3-phosphate transport system substrate-binding protein